VLEASPLKDMAVVDGLMQLNDEALEIELAKTTTLEGWLRSCAEGMKTMDPTMVDPMSQAAGTARVAREIIAFCLYLHRHQGERPERGAFGNGTKPTGYL
jgi:hypothetical protein